MEITEPKLPVRKRNRLRDYDYSQNGVYFITVCSKDKQWLFWKAGASPKIVGASIARPPSNEHYSDIGTVVEEMIKEVPSKYNGIELINYVVMPNHIHLLLMLCADTRGRAMHAPTPDVSRVIQQLKGAVTKKVGASVWQKSFHDHIVRNEKSLKSIYEYIDYNPLRWELDSLNIWNK